MSVDAEIMQNASASERQILSDLDKSGEIESQLAKAIIERVSTSTSFLEYCDTINKGTQAEQALGREMYDRREWDNPIFELLAQRIQKRRANGNT
jgi:hypothetical protein